MKYIRTTSCIAEIVKESCCYYGRQPKCWDLKGHPYFMTEDDKDFPKYRFSDSIEKLCDEFVYEYQTGAMVINKKIIAMPDIVKTYGAIWTDKGLIYVAKMNEKGELELL